RGVLGGGARPAQLRRLAGRVRPAPDGAAAEGLAAVNVRHHELHSPAIGAAGSLVPYGHYGRPVLAFPAESGRAWDWQAIGVSGNYDPAAWNGWGERGEAAYFNNPFDYVGHLGGDHLEWLRSRLSVLVVCGQGMWEDSTGALESSKQLARLLDQKGIRHE